MVRFCLIEYKNNINFKDDDSETINPIAATQSHLHDSFGKTFVKNDVVNDSAENVAVSYNFLLVVFCLFICLFVN